MKSKPVLCLVTNRTHDGTGWETALVERVHAAARAGVHLIQVRERDLDGGSLMRFVCSCVEAVRGTPARIIVNDRLDVAIAAGAHGIHLRADSFAAARVRTLAPAPMLIGRSVHSVAEAIAAFEAGSLDYLMFGTVFETSSKPGQPAAGLGGLAAVAGATPLPVLAIGGMTLSRADEVMAAGAAGLAGISMFDTPRVVP